MDMIDVLFYGSVAIAVVLGFVSRRSIILRLISVTLLCAVASFWLLVLIVAHRLVELKGYQRFNVTNYSDLPEDFKFGVTEFNAISRSTLFSLVAVVIALAAIAIYPIRLRANDDEVHR